MASVVSLAMIGSPTSHMPVAVDVADQRHGHARDAVLVGPAIVHTITVSIKPHMVANRSSAIRWRLVAKVGVQEHVAGPSTMGVVV